MWKFLVRPACLFEALPYTQVPTDIDVWTLCDIEAIDVYFSYIKKSDLPVYTDEITGI